MAMSGSSRDPGSARIGSPIRAAGIPFGICIAMYLAVAGVVQGLAWPDAAAAVASDISSAPALHAVASSPPVGAGESPRRDSPGQGSDRTDSSRECSPSEAIDTQSMNNGRA